MISGAIHAVLAGNAAVAALVGGEDGARIFPSYLPANEIRPAIVYQFKSGAPASQVGAAGLQSTTLVLTCWGQSLALAQQVANACKTALDGYGGTAEGTRFQSAAATGDQQYDPPIDDSDRGLHAHVEAFAVLYQET